MSQQNLGPDLWSSTKQSTEIKNKIIDYLGKNITEVQFRSENENSNMKEDDKWLAMKLPNYGKQKYQKIIHYILHFTFYILHFTFYILHFTFYILHFTFYILHFEC